MADTTAAAANNTNSARRYANVEQAADALERLCRKLVAEHTTLLGLMKDKREALKRADAQVMSRVCQMEHRVVQAISEMEKQRLTVAGDLTLMVSPDAAKPMKLAELADRLDEPVRGRLLVMRQQLLEAMGKVREESSIARRATQSLMNHLTGLLRGVTAASTGVSTYSARGDRPRAAGALSTISMTA